MDKEYAKHIQQKILEVCSFGAVGFYPILFSVVKWTGADWYFVAHQMQDMEREGRLNLGVKNGEDNKRGAEDKDY